MKKPMILIAALAVAVGSTLYAESLKEINERMTKLGSEMMDLRGEISDEAQALEMEYVSGKHDTPEMKEMRAKSDKLRQELIMLEKDLRGKFNALPEFSERVAKFKVKQANYSKMRRERQALFEKRKAIFAEAAAKRSEAKPEKAAGDKPAAAPVAKHAATPVAKPAATPPAKPAAAPSAKPAATPPAK